MKISILISGCLAQAPDYGSDNSNGQRTTMTADQALKAYVPSMSDSMREELLNSNFDISNFDLKRSQHGFFLGAFTIGPMDIHVDYTVGGNVGFSGCGADDNGERFTVLNGSITSSGDWEFIKTYSGDGPDGYTHSWKYFGNLMGKVWNGWVTHVGQSNGLAQAFFYPNMEQDDLSYTCSAYPATISTGPIIPENAIFAESCSVQMANVENKYLSNMTNRGQKRKLRKKFEHLNKILKNVLNGKMQKRNRKGLTAVVEEPQLENADLEQVYNECFRDFIPEVFANFQHGGNHLMDRSEKMVKKICNFNLDENDRDFCETL